MNELSLKLKTEMVRQLRINKSKMDDVYIRTGDKSYTKRELANEIENETEFGIKMLTQMVSLAFDLLSRGKR